MFPTSSARILPSGRLSGVGSESRPLSPHSSAQPAGEEAASARTSILIAHPWVGRGGSEATAVWAVQALYEEYAVTVVTASELDWEELNQIYGTRIDGAKVNFLRAPRLPSVNSGERLAYLQNGFFERFCASMASDFEVCVSAYNFIDFGKPGVQLLGDFSFNEEIRLAHAAHSQQARRHSPGLLRQAYLRTGDLIRKKGKPLDEQANLVLANSQWSAGVLEDDFRLRKVPVLFPPVALTAQLADTPREELTFASLGRIAPEKELEKQVRILAEVRAQGVKVRLAIVGEVGDDSYGTWLREFLKPYRDWISLTGFLDAAEKQRVLSGVSFGIHSRSAEPFGIAVAELASLGCVPFVPAEGGVSEIVGDERLIYQNEEEAVAKICALLGAPEEVAKLRAALQERVGQFGPLTFMRSLRGYVAEFAAKSGDMSWSG